MSTRQSITLSGIPFRARVGVLPHEREPVQPLEADLAVRRAESADAAPDDVLDCGGLSDRTDSALRNPHLRYFEEIAEAVLITATVRRARVTVRMPQVALPGPLARADAAVHCERE